MTKRKNLHLTISAFIITIVALTYGLFPSTILPKLFDFNVHSIDLKHTFRAIMGLYLAMVGHWVMGILKPLHWQSSTISNVLFMTGLALGRMVSLVMDGVPSISFSVGFALEIILALWGIRNLKRYRVIIDQ